MKRQFSPRRYQRNRSVRTLLDKIEGLKNGAMGVVVFRCDNIPAKSLRSFLGLTKSLGLQLKVAKSYHLDIANLSCADREGPLIMITGKIEQLMALQKAQYQYERYLKAGQKSPVDVVISRGPTNLKIGKNLALFQAYLGVKPVKGFVDIQETKTICTAGAVVQEDQEKILKLLSYKISQAPRPIFFSEFFPDSLRQYCLQLLNYRDLDWSGTPLDQIEQIPVKTARTVSKLNSLPERVVRVLLAVESNHK